MKIFDAIAQVVMEGGLRRAAMMATLNANHPDILEFVSAKTADGELSNFNISVTVDDGPSSVGTEAWDAICRRAYDNGEPGVVFLNNINNNNPLLKSHGRIVAVNACSEQPLYNFGSCVLGHVVLPYVVKKLGNYTELSEMVRLLVRLLDRVIDVNHYPLPQIAGVARDIRNIGVGVMGWNDLLVANEIPFVSQDALGLAREIGWEIYRSANEESWALAKEKGGYRPGCRRNSFLTTIAPTGHTARLAGVEHSIYPPYSQGLQMTPEQHLDHIASWQTNVDSAISYTISFPNDAPASIVDHIYRGAHERGLKAMAVYRDNSREGQPCSADGTCTT
jgi:ribonucleoside-diphosphate reductase alpha chain